MFSHLLEHQMFGLFKKKSGIITVTLNAKLQPMHRGELEDSLADVCKENSIDVEFPGGGSLLEPSGEIKECDMDIQIEAIDDKKIAFVIDMLTAMLAPKGSYYRLEGQDKRIDFGKHEGLGLYLNGTDLPDEVYASSDSNFVYDECERLLKGVAMVNSHWQGPTETAFYMYGPNFDQMHELIKPLLDSYPLCQQCRVVRIA